MDKVFLFFFVLLAGYCLTVIVEQKTKLHEIARYFVNEDVSIHYPILTTGTFSLGSDHYVYTTFFLSKEDALKGEKYPLVISKMNPERDNIVES